MKKWIIFHIALLLLTILSGCVHKKDTNQIKTLKFVGSEVKVDHILNPRNLTIYDSLLFIKEPPHSSKDGKCLRIINKNDFSYVTSAAYLGRGPGELTNPASLIIDENTNLLWFADWGKYKFFKFPIDSILNNHKFKPNESFSLKKGLIPMMNVFIYGPNTIGFTSLNIQNSLINFIEITGERIDSLAIPNKIFPDIWENMGYSDNPILINYNPDHQLIVVASRFKNSIGVIDMDGNPKFLLTKLPFDTKKEIDTKFPSKIRTFFKIISDEKYIYCLYVGGIYQEYDFNKNRTIMHYPKRLLIFDWEGNGKYDIQLDHPTIFTAFDKNKKKLFGTTDSFENGLVVYDCSNL